MSTSGISPEPTHSAPTFATSQPTVCPGLFYAVPASDGNLFRIRIPGGQLTRDQARQVADFAEQMAASIQITNRANFQFRTPTAAVPLPLLQHLQQMGLAGAEPSVDHLRNVMASPTAGIDPTALIDTRPWVTALDTYLSTHPELLPLSAKFSVGLDGGESVGIGDRLNDLWLIAAKQQNSSQSAPQPPIGFHLVLSLGEGKLVPTGLWMQPAAIVPVVAAIAQAAIEFGAVLAADPLIQPTLKGKPPRLRQILAAVGIETFLDRVRQAASLQAADLQAAGLQAVDLLDQLDQLDQPEQSDSAAFAPRPSTDRHLGIHAQRQSGFCYVGIGVRLGWITPEQLRQLADFAATYGDGTLRLTPWQNLLLPNVPQTQVIPLQQALARSGFSTFPDQIWGNLVACAGLPGCKASATHTQPHAIALAQSLETQSLDRPIKIHITGCPKSCAQHHPSDLTLLGTSIEQDGERIEAYQIYAGDHAEVSAINPDQSSRSDTGDHSRQDRFGKPLSTPVPADQIVAVIQKLIEQYQQPTQAGTVQARLERSFWGGGNG